MSGRPTAALMALQAALAAAFAAEPTLVAEVRGRIHDGPPRGAVLPCLSFADARGRDFSSGDSQGTRVQLALEALTADGDRSRALAILDAAIGRATTGPLALADGELVSIRVVDTTVERLKDGRSWRARAVLEALIDG